jgi:hypothetical protein
MRKQACCLLPGSIKRPPDWTCYLQDFRKSIEINKL